MIKPRKNVQALGRARSAALLSTHDLVATHAPGMRELGAEVEVRRHPTARRVTLRVLRTRRAVIVTLPVHCDLAEAGSFVAKNIDWVRERLCMQPTGVPFAHGAAIPLRGTGHLLEFRGCGVRSITVTAEATGVPRIVVGGDAAGAPRRLLGWLADQAGRDIDQRVCFHAARLGLRPKRIAIRDQSTRWGSCSTTGVLSFSWRLVLAPPFVLDYVAAHEVAHLKEMNHGPRFWTLVRATCGDMDAAKRWLKQSGNDLHRYGAAD
jgi:hypothetical protein